MTRRWALSIPRSEIVRFVAATASSCSLSVFASLRPEGPLIPARAVMPLSLFSPGNNMRERRATPQLKAKVWRHQVATLDFVRKNDTQALLAVKTPMKIKNPLPGLLIFLAACPCWAQTLPAFISGQVPNLVETCKGIHAHPELSHHEEHTSALLADELRKAGYTVRERVGKYADGSQVALPKMDLALQPASSLRRGHTILVPINLVVGLSHEIDRDHPYEGLERAQQGGVVPARRGKQYDRIVRRNDLNWVFQHDEIIGADPSIAGRCRNHIDLAR